VPKPSTTSDTGGLVVQIAGMLPALTPAEQRVARVVVADPGAAAARTVTDLATVAGTSEATVIRFCRSVGLPGYPQLRLRLAAEAGRRTGPAGHGSPRRGGTDPGIDLALIIAAVAAEDARAIRDTAAGLDPAVCTTVVEAILAAGRVDVHGADGSAHVAADLRQRLQRLGVPAYGWPDGVSAVASADLLGPGDVAIGVSHGGRTAQTVQVLRRAAQRGAMAVAVTSSSRSALGRAADLVLVTATGDSADRQGSGAGRAARSTVVDVLVVGVTRRRVTRTGE
jgi:DNA-binding MurR/RpiR family transcriptional regulator